MQQWDKEVNGYRSNNVVNHGWRWCQIILLVGVQFGDRVRRHGFGEPDFPAPGFVRTVRGSSERLWARLIAAVGLFRRRRGRCSLPSVCSAGSLGAGCCQAPTHHCPVASRLGLVPAGYFVKLLYMYSRLCYAAMLARKRFTRVPVPVRLPMTICSSPSYTYCRIHRGCPTTPPLVCTVRCIHWHDAVPRLLGRTRGALRTRTAVWTYAGTAAPLRAFPAPARLPV
jgi:hypothetical protein